MELPTFLRFASDATIVAICGIAVLTVSAIAHLGERRRTNRADADRVGWMPWRDVSALSLFAGLALLGFAGIGWLKA